MALSIHCFYNEIGPCASIGNAVPGNPPVPCPMPPVGECQLTKADDPRAPTPGGFFSYGRRRPEKREISHKQ